MSSARGWKGKIADSAEISSSIRAMKKQLLERLFDRAVNNLKGSHIQGKLPPGKAYELHILLTVFGQMRANGFSVTAVSPPGISPRILKFAGSPCDADKQRYTYFELNDGKRPLEAWISVQVQTLSRQLAGSGGRASYHEMDVGVFEPLAGHAHRPTHDQLAFAASCKHRHFLKEFLREALGIRRETAVLTAAPVASEAPWFVTHIPAAPGIPIVLFSSDSRCSKYQEPVDSLGVYVRHIPFP